MKAGHLSPAQTEVHPLNVYNLRVVGRKAIRKVRAQKTLKHFLVSYLKISP